MPTWRGIYGANAANGAQAVYIDSTGTLGTQTSLTSSLGDTSLGSAALNATTTGPK